MKIHNSSIIEVLLDAFDEIETCTAIEYKSLPNIDLITLNTISAVTNEVVLELLEPAAAAIYSSNSSQNYPYYSSGRENVIPRPPGKIINVFPS